MSTEKFSRNSINILRENLSLYNKIKESNGDLSGRSNEDLFLMSLMIGYYFIGRRDPLGGEYGATYDYFKRRTDIHENGWHLIKAIAVSDKGDMEVLLDIGEIIKIAEEYANTGIKKLYELYFQNEYNFIERAEELLIKAYKDQGIKEFE
jgi:hypothetical protein